MIDALKPLIASGPVEAVLAWRDEDLAGRIVKVAIVFSSSTLTISADGFADEIRLAVSDTSAADLSSGTDESSSYPWDLALGRELSSGWSLTNQQGYEDGVRFEFSSLHRQPRTVIEMIVAASALEVYHSAHSSSPKQAESVPSSTSDIALAAARRFVESFERVFHSDWAYTSAQLAGDERGASLLLELMGESASGEGPAGSFLHPSRDPADQNWGNYCELLQAYAALRSKI